MRNRLQKSRPHPTPAPSSDFTIHSDFEQDSVAHRKTKSETYSSSPPTLSQVSQGVVNSRTMPSVSSRPHQSMKPLPSTPSVSVLSPHATTASNPSIPRTVSTIRTVPSFEHKYRPSFDEDTSSDASPSPARQSHLSSPVTSNASYISIGSHGHHTQNTDRSPDLKAKKYASGTYLDTSGPSLEVPSRTSSPGMSPRPSLEVPRRESSLGGTGRTGMVRNTSGTFAPTRTMSPPIIPQEDGHHNSESPSTNGWDSTVGKAGLGKTGRVINRLVSENESLKRDLQIERLKADESKQAARLLEDKMERMVSDYESRLLEANVTKTLLARKERQVESLQSAIELEKKRTSDAQERERTWRGELDKTRTDTKRQVEDATTHAALMEGRYNAISSHWREQGDEVKRAMARMGGEIQGLSEERRRDDDKISVLRDVCDQQDGNIRDLRRQKEDIARKFDEYKREQEEALRSIKTQAAQREAEQERTLAEAKEVLDKLKWALNVKGNVGWAE